MSEVKVLKYLKSRNGERFSGCYELIDEDLAEVRGIYYILSPPRIFLTSRGKLAENLDELIFHEHEVQFSNNVQIFNIFAEPGEAVVINPENDITLTIKSSINVEDTVMLKANRYYLITHPRPRTR